MRAGGAIYGCDGLIQHNIFENNKANEGGAIADCHGTIQNNLFYQNSTFYGTGKPATGFFEAPQGVINECSGGALYNCNGTIRNNTIVDNYNNTSRGLQPGALSKCQGTIVNNIIAHTTMTAAVEFDQCAEPAYCLFRAPHPGTGNLAGDPQFVNPAQGDYRLQAGSPAIDAGKRFEDLKEDLEGHQRGLKNSSGAARGDGSHTDIGAYEALPSPVAVWLPHGGPPGLTDGQTLSVSWRLEPPAGATIRLRLYKAGRFIYEFGKITAATGAATTPVRLPTAMLASGSDYTIQGASVANPALSADTARFTITRRNGAGRAWTLY